MVCLYTVPSWYHAQTDPAILALTKDSGTHTGTISALIESLQSNSQENTFSTDEEKVIPIPDEFHVNGLLTLIYAEDDQDDAIIFRDAITQIAPHIKLYSVNTGHALCELLTLVQPDIIFLDLDMPGKNGLECMVEIRNNVLYKTIPIVVYSCTSRPSNIHTAYEMGADLFFIKPFIYRELLSSLKEILCLNWHTPAKVKEQYLINNQYTAFM